MTTTKQDAHKFVARLTLDNFKKLAELAKANNRSINNQLNQLLSEYKIDN